jgi:hypothetical protein
MVNKPSSVPAGKSEAHRKAEATLPPEQREIFNNLVEEYRNSALVHTGQTWVNYVILADLIAAGWRKIDLK